MWYKLIYLKSGKKKDPLLTLSNYSLDITGADGSASFSVTYEGDGELTVFSSDENIATASVLNNVVTVTYVSEGFVNIIVSLAESKKYLGDEKICSVTCIKSVPTLTLSSSTLSVDGATGSNTFTYTYDGDGDISISSSDTNVATVSTTENTITVTYVTAGSISITVTAAGTNRFSSNSAICTVTCSRTATTMTVSNTSLSIAGATGSGTFTYTCDGDGAITVTSSNTNVATVSSSGATITVTYKAAGSATITVSMADGVKYAATSKTCAVTCSKSNPSYKAPTAKSLTYTRSNASTIASQALLNAGTITSGHGTIQYSANNSSWSTSIPTGTTAKTYTVYWRIVGNAKYNDKASTAIKVTISKRTLAIPGLSGTTSFTNNAATSRSVSSNGNYNSTYMYTSGTWSASTPGTFTVYWNLRDTANTVWSGNTTAARSATWSISAGSTTFYVNYCGQWATFTTTYAAWANIPDTTRSNTNILAVRYHYYAGSYGATLRYAVSSGYIGIRIDTAGHWGPQNGTYYGNLNGNSPQSF